MEAPLIELFDIPGYTDYCATKDGQIYSYKTHKFLTKSDDTYGYDTVTLDNKTRKVHRVMAETFLNNPENHPHIDHINRNRKDNRLENLRYISKSENMKNRFLTKRDPKLRYITIKNTTYKVAMKSKNNKVYKSFKTLAEAQAFRDAILNEWNSQA